MYYTNETLWKVFVYTLCSNIISWLLRHYKYSLGPHLDIYTLFVATRCSYTTDGVGLGYSALRGLSGSQYQRMLNTLDSEAVDLDAYRWYGNLKSMTLTRPRCMENLAVFCVMLLLASGEGFN